MGQGWVGKGQREREREVGRLSDGELPGHVARAEPM